MKKDGDPNPDDDELREEDVRLSDGLDDREEDVRLEGDDE